MTALRTRLGRPREIFWSVVVGILVGIASYLVTYQALVFVFRPADTPWISPTAAVVARTAPIPSCPSNQHRVSGSYDQRRPATPACAPAQR